MDSSARGRDPVTDLRIVGRKTELSGQCDARVIKANSAVFGIREGTLCCGR